MSAWEYTSEVKVLDRGQHTEADCEKRGCSPASERPEGIDWGFHFDDAGYCLGCGGCGDPDCCGPCDCRFDK